MSSRRTYGPIASLEFMAIDAAKNAMVQDHSKVQQFPQILGVNHSRIVHAL